MSAANGGNESAAAASQPQNGRSSNNLFQIQAHLITSGLFQDPSFSGRLLKLSLNGYHREAVDFYVDMLRGALRFGVDNVLPVQNSLIHFYACCGLMDVAWKVFEGMLTKDSVSWNTIIDGFSKIGEMGLAHKLFDTMPTKNVVSWNVMMTGYLNFRKPGNALKLFREMVVQGFESNDTTAVNVIAACGRSSRLKEGRSVHGFLVKAFISLSLIIDTALIDMYSKCGRVDLAQAIFNRMPSKNLVSWNAMILGHCVNANPLDGLNLYSEMVDEIRCKDESAVKFDKNVKLDEVSFILPDEVTFIGILCACARKLMLTEGRDYLSQIDVFHVKPNFAHYWCMANLMANVGLMQEAVDILRNIPIDEDVSPESSLWAGLFGSCRFQGDVSLAEQIAKGLIAQDPQNFSHHNLLVNIYAAAGRWEEVARTKELMKGRGIKRVPCCSLKDLQEIVRIAKVGDTREKDLQMALME
ncbi:Pentatricopeptide repeat-containing protein [Sesamum angolense]|uniref:Pentatricopeptide repeat-containing protein n=1 Tax=Sesamum angolense TaxID=2727404 RepID=A0AAE1X208_9LAMI|nr:Pentatricopeptide repeat-containing protein [Sesamum angolense]